MKGVTYLTIKALDSGGDRIIEGWATTPAQDRVGDEVVPEGARYTLPLPLLAHHDHNQPIGAVISASVTRAGIRIRAKLTEGVAKADEIWKLIQDGAINAVSIGFRALKSTPLPKGGVRFDLWDWYELSCVAVPCNAEAKITIGKSLAYDVQREPQSPATTTHFGYRKGMTVGGIDLAYIHAANAEGAKKDYQEQLADKGRLDQFGFIKASMAMRGAASALSRVKDLEERIALIEAKGVVYRGLYNASDEYTRGDMVTFGGSIFHATRETQGLAPQHGGNEERAADHPWQLAVRRGRDGTNR